MGILVSSPAFAKRESSSEDATSVLLYGKYNDTLVPLKVESDGSVTGGGGSSGWTTDNATITTTDYIVGIGTASSTWAGSIANVYKDTAPNCSSAVCYPPYTLGAALNSSYVYANTTADVTWSIRGYAYQTGSAANTSGGHAIGVAGATKDTAVGKLNLAGTEGRTDAYGGADRYTGVLGLVNMNTASFTGTAAGFNSVILGSNNGTSVAYLASPVTVGANKYAFYGANDVVITTGYFGMGTVSPLHPFQANISSGTTYGVTAANSAALAIYNTSSTNNTVSEIKLGQANASATLATGVRILGIQTDHTAAAESAELAIVTRNAGTNAERMRINATGVGIGSTIPAAALDVTGSIRSSAGTVGQAACWKADKTLGQCTTVVGAGGGCTCS